MFLYLLNGTKYSISKEKEELFVDYILEGERYFHRNYGTTNFSIGRSAVYCKGGDIIYKNLELLLEIKDIYRKKELLQYYISYNDFSKIERVNKYFPLSGTIVSNGPNAFMAVRGSQKGNGLTDVVNNQGGLNYNLSYGSNSCYMFYGDEYKSIGAVFDFAMYPGTTSFYESDQQLYERYESEFNKSWGRVKRPNINCKGYNDEEKLITVLKTDLFNDGLSGDNLFIFKGNDAFALGTNFKNEKYNSNPIVTTVDQCLSGDKKDYSIILDYGMQITNRAFVYTNLCDYELVCESRDQFGSYSRGDAAGDDTIQKEKVFVAYYNWENDVSGMNYAYAVSPISNEFQLSDIVTIENNSICQLIEFSDGTIIGYSYVPSTYKDKAGKTYFLPENDFFVWYQ